MISDIDAGKAFQLNLHEAILFVNESWAMVPDKVIANCFKHAGFVAPKVPVATDPEPEPEPEVIDHGNIFEKLSAMMGLPKEVHVIKFRPTFTFLVYIVFKNQNFELTTCMSLFTYKYMQGSHLLIILTQAFIYMPFSNVNKMCCIFIVLPLSFFKVTFEDFASVDATEPTTELLNETEIVSLVINEEEDEEEDDEEDDEVENDKDQ